LLVDFGLGQLLGFFAAAMLLGRLELLTVLVLFAPSFWRG
jgi:Trk-type K+ transport system membrane component